MPNFTTTRTVTPAALKWLLNERAAIAGAISKASARQEVLSAKLGALQCTVERQNRLLQESLQKNTALQVTMSAIDTTIGLAYADVEPKAAGIVHAWAGRYGERGALIKFVEQTLQNAGSLPVRTAELINKAIAQFALSIVGPAERRSLNHSVKGSLRQLARKNLAEKTIGTVRAAVLGAGAGNSPLHWQTLLCRLPPLMERLPMTAQRTLTRPDIKWLANELAAAAGEMARIDEEVARLVARRTRLEAMHQALSQVAGLVGTPDLGSLVPSVRAHGKYGGRGRLREWLKLLLQGAAPAAVDTATMVRLAEDAFELTFSSPDERDRFRRDSLTRQLRWFLARGLVERMHDLQAAACTVGVWRWKTGEPTVEALAEQDFQALALERGTPWP